MKKIGIDARLYGQTGVGVYIRNLLYFLDFCLPANYQLYVYLMDEDYKKASFKNPNIIVKKANFKWHTLEEQREFLEVINSHNLDLMHFTYFSYPIGYKKKFISTIHDLTPLLLQTGKASTRNIVIYKVKLFFLKKVFKSQVKNAEYIITPTESVKEQLIEYYGGKITDKIIPIHEGVNEEIKKQKENSLLKGTIGEDFFFTLGNFYPHKNIASLVEAFAQVKTDRKLILAGSKNLFSERIKNIVKKLKQEGRIIIFENPNISDLVFFYKHAGALINPSISEGFGLPLVEAAYFNCPVIASNIPVFKEILGEEYISFDPNDINDIIEKIQQFQEYSRKFDNKKINAQYSFEQMTRETLNVYKKALNM